MRGLALCGVAVLAAGAAAQWPAKKQERPILLAGGTVHSLAGAVLEQGAVLFENGKITAVGRDLHPPEGALEVDVTGKHVWPGLIAAATVLGLVEINAVRSTRDFAEVGGITPEVRAEVSFHPDSVLLPVARANGVTLALSVPQGGLISGSSALMMLDGWTWEDMALRAPVGLHLRWPSMRVGTGKDREKRVKERDARIRDISRAFADARAYLDAKRAETGSAPYHAADRRWEAMIPVLEGKIPVFVHADELRQIEAACDWAKELGLRLVLVGGRDAWRVTDLLRANDVAVVVTGTHRLPARRFADYDTPFTLPRKLHEAGVLFCIAGSGTAFDAANERNLPYQAATAAAHGLPEEAAIRAITIDAARILGVDGRTGTLEPGKDATLIVTTGSPLDIRSRVTMEFIQGRRVDLDSRHDRLFRKYREKYRRLGLLGKPR